LPVGLVWLNWCFGEVKMSDVTYAFVFNGSDWRKSVDDDWDTSIVELSEQDKVLGHRQIDGVICKVLKISDGKIIAITGK
jgi:hypothetical protein